MHNKERTWVYCRSGGSQELTKGLRAQTATCSISRRKRSSVKHVGFNALLIPQDWPYLDINNTWRLEYCMQTATHLIRLLDTHGLLGHPAAFWSRKATQQRECKQRILCNWIVVLCLVPNRNQGLSLVLGPPLLRLRETPDTDLGHHCQPRIPQWCYF